MNNTKQISKIDTEQIGQSCCGPDLPKAQQFIFRDFLSNIDELSKVINLDSETAASFKEVHQRYHMRIPLYYLSLAKNLNDFCDPILLQCLPNPNELVEKKDQALDPLAEEETSPVPFLVHRYPDRVLLLVTNRCFMYCRHCTRKRIWKDDHPEPTTEDINKALDYVKNNKQIREVIISGGDPLNLTTKKIDDILSLVSDIKHIQVIRIGSRAPVVFPARIDDHLCQVLAKYDKLWINVQFNHPLEITKESKLACRKIQNCAIPLSNQSVLLKGINDDPAVMIELCQKLQSIRIRPYYLFQCDPVLGNFHFRTPIFKGLDILKKMRGFTSGMCIPTFVIDGIDGKGKVPLGPNYLISEGKGCIILKNYQGQIFKYYNSEN